MNRQTIESTSRRKVLTQAESMARAGRTVTLTFDGTYWRAVGE